jgi:hypothetical protein
MATTKTLLILSTCTLFGCVAIGDGARAPEPAELQQIVKGEAQIRTSAP